MTMAGKHYNYSVKMSPNSVIIRTIGVILGGVMLGLLSYVPLTMLPHLVPMELPITFISIVFQIIVLCAVSFGIIALLLNWMGTTYIISDKEIVVQQGLLSVKQKIYPLAGHEEVKMYQSLLGKWFDYGTVAVFQPVLQKYITLVDVPDPDLLAEAIRQKKSKEGLPSSQVIMPIKQGR